MVAVNSGQQPPNQQAGVYIGAFRFSDPVQTASLCVIQSGASVKVQRPIGCWAVGWEVVFIVPEGSLEQKHMYTQFFHTQMTAVLGQTGWCSAAGHHSKVVGERGESNCSRLFVSVLLSSCVLSLLSICASPFSYPQFPLYPSSLFLPGGQEWEDR